MNQAIYHEIRLILLFWTVKFLIFLFTDKSFANVLQRLETCLSVNSKLCGKLVLFVPTIFF